MTRKQMGTIAEVAVMRDLMQRGYSIFSQIGEDSRIDLIAVKGKETVRIQVKSSEETVNGAIGFNRVKKHKNGGYIYSPDDCDVFAVYNRTRDIICYFGWTELSEFNAFYIRFIPTKNNQDRKVRMYDKFQDFEIAVQSTKDFHALVA